MYKYGSLLEQIPQSARADINEKILNLITSGSVEKSGITNQDIFNSYTGDGGLHGLERKNYRNYHEYSEAKKEVEQGQFFTAPGVCEYIMECLKPGANEVIYDLTCGMGNFANCVPNESNFYGSDIDLKALKVASYLYPAAHFSHSDIRGYAAPVMADLVVGNPPFNLRWSYKEDTVLSQLFYCIKAAEILKPGGLLAAIVPMSFMDDDFAQSGQVEAMEGLYDFVVQLPLPDNIFEYLGVSFATKLIVFQRKSAHLPERPFTFKFELETDENKVYEKHIKPLQIQRKQLKSKLALECVGLDKVGDGQFTAKVTKLLYDIRQNKRTVKYLPECEKLLKDYLTQKKPDNVSYEEWEKMCIKERDVIKKLKQTLSNANKVYRNEVVLIKTDYGFATRDYREDAGADVPIQSINDTVLGGEIRFDHKGYERLINRKMKQFGQQGMSFEEMRLDQNIAQFLDSWAVYSQEREEELKLNDVQRQDVNKMLQKRYGILQYEMGSGKTLCALAMAQYHMQHSNVRNIFVVSDAISINNTWEEALDDYSIPFYRISTRTDAVNIPKGQIVLVTLGIASKYKRELKRHMKICSQKVCMIFDESDSISNPYSARTKAILDIFRRTRYTYCTTGTITRNNIVESAPQLELLYNNSFNHISWAEELYYVDEDGEVRTEYNPYYGEPIPAYRKGYKLFAQSHLPERITVFGADKFTQDIYNADVLKSLLSKTVITKTFDEVSGRKIHELHQLMVPFHFAETEVYKKAIEEFHEMRWNYFSSTGNSRKDSMFRILQQLTLLLKICADPASMAEYNSNLASNKHKRLIEFLTENSDERVAIGVRHVDVAHKYAEYIRQAFPGRPVFVVTGGSASFKKRRQIVKQLKETTNGILVSTQQAFSKSQSIDFVDKVVLPELHYNNASMSQYYFRFIRYTSVKFKHVYFLTYENSIESNLLRMVMAKEKINLFMKDQEVDDDELFERFGADRALVNMLMTREYDENGKLHIRWGEQNIA